MSDHPTRPQTPQPLLHRLPTKPFPSSTTKPSKHIIILLAPTSTAGKVQIATSVSTALSCPLFQGDSMHETAAKTASVGGGSNEDRYQRMWMSKMTRTGLLFPRESRAATEGFSGFGGSSTSTSRRGSASSVASESEGSVAGSFVSVDAAVPVVKFVNRPPAVLKEEDGNPALMVMTHPEVEQWHRDCIRKAVGEYGIGVIFVPLYVDEEEELPVRKPLDPRTMTSFGDFGAEKKATVASLEEEVVLKIDVNGNVDEIVQDVVEGVRGIMG